MNDVLLQNAVWGVIGAVLVAVIGAASIQLKGWLDRRDTRRDAQTVSEATLRQSNIDDSRNLRAEMMKMLDATQADVRDLTEQLRQERQARMQESESHVALLNTERTEREAAGKIHAQEIERNSRKLQTVRGHMQDLQTRVQRVGDMVMALDVAGRKLHPLAWVEIVMAAVGTPELPPLALLIGDDLTDPPTG